MAVGANPRQSNGHARRQLRAKVRSLGLPCALCGRPIDYSLPAGDPWCYELDEKRPVSRWAEFGYASKQQAALDPNNVQPAHRICNQRKSNKTHTPASPGLEKARQKSGYYKRKQYRPPIKPSVDW